MPESTINIFILDNSSVAVASALLLTYLQNVAAADWAWLNMEVADNRAVFHS